MRTPEYAPIPGIRVVERMAGFKCRTSQFGAMSPEELDGIKFGMKMK